MDKQHLRAITLTIPKFLSSYLFCLIYLRSDSKSTVPQYFLSQIVSIVFTKVLVFARPSRFAISCRCCNEHSLLLTIDLSSIGQIITLCVAAGVSQVRSLLISFVELCYLVFTPNFLRHLSHSLNMASIRGRGKFLSS